MIEKLTFLDFSDFPLFFVHIDVCFHPCFLCVLIFVLFFFFIFSRLRFFPELGWWEEGGGCGPTFKSCESSKSLKSGVSFLVSFLCVVFLTCFSCLGFFPELGLGWVVPTRISFNSFTSSYVFCVLILSFSFFCSFLRLKTCLMCLMFFSFLCHDCSHLFHILIFFFRFFFFLFLFGKKSRHEKMKKLKDEHTKTHQKM